MVRDFIKTVYKKDKELAVAVAKIFGYSIVESMGKAKNFFKKLEKDVNSVKDKYFKQTLLDFLLSGEQNAVDTPGLVDGSEEYWGIAIASTSELVWDSKDRKAIKWFDKRGLFEF